MTTIKDTSWLASQLNLHLAGLGEGPLALRKLRVEGDEPLAIPLTVGKLLIEECVFSMGKGVRYAIDLRQHFANFRISQCVVGNLRGPDIEPFVAL